MRKFQQLSYDEVLILIESLIERFRVSGMHENDSKLYDELFQEMQIRG